MELNTVAAEETEKYYWSNNFYYMFKEGNIVHWGRVASSDRPVDNRLLPLR